MEKPVRIISNEKIRAFNEKVRHGLEHAINFMLNVESNNKIQVGGFEPFLMPIEAYLSTYKKQSILIKIYSENAYEGELYWFFELKTAIILGSLMRMMPINTLETKLSELNFDSTDQDSFGEVGNQLCGILDRAFRTLTNKKNIHLRMDFEKKVYPNEAIQISSFKNNEEYVVLLCNLTIPKYEVQKLTLLLPRSLYEVLLNLEIKLDGITPRIILIHSSNEELCESIQTQMNSRYTKVIVAKTADDIFSMIDTPDLCAIGIELKSVSIPPTMQESIYIKRLVGNKVFSKTPHFFTWPNATENGVKELEKIGLRGATTGSFEANFIPWAQAFVNSSIK